MTLTLTDHTQTVSTTPLSLLNGSSTIATSTTKAAVQVVADLSALTGSDLFRISLLEKVTAAGSQRTIESWFVQGTQQPPLWTSPTFLLGHGWDWSITRISGSDRSISTSVRAVSGATFTFTDGSETVGTTEHGMPNDSTTLTDQTAEGVYHLFVDGGNIAAGDRFKVEVYEKAVSGGTRRQLITPVSLVTGEHLALPGVILKHGWQMTVQKMAGTDRVIDWSIRKAA